MPNWALPPLPAQFVAAAHRVFVGRTSERAQLEWVWDQVADGVRQTVFITGAAQAAIRLADDDALRAVEPLVAAYHGFNLVVGQCVTVLGSANLLLAQIRALRGDADGAETHFHKALAADGRIGSAVHRAETLARWPSRGVTSACCASSSSRVGHGSCRTI